MLKLKRLVKIVTIGSQQSLIVEYSMGVEYEPDAPYLWFDLTDLQTANEAVIAYPGDRVFYKTAEEAEEAIVLDYNTGEWLNRKE